MNNNPCQKLGIDKPINAIIINVISSQLFRFIALIIPIGIAILMPQLALILRQLL